MNTWDAQVVNEVLETMKKLEVREFLFYKISKATFPSVSSSTDRDGGLVR